MKILGWIVFGFFAIGVGLYPVLYFFVDMSQGFLSSKSTTLLQNPVWNFFFYQHILLGGIVLLIGWIQFSKNLRSKYLHFHRFIGKVYVTACILSGIAGLYIAFYATGGIVASLGFTGLALSWLFTTTKAFLLIRLKKVTEHKDWMIRSYALTFAAVTLRIWLPLSQILQIDFIPAYVVIAWLCWMPNLFVAEWIIRSKHVPA